MKRNVGILLALTAFAALLPFVAAQALPNRDVYLLKGMTVDLADNTVVTKADKSLEQLGTVSLRLDDIRGTEVTFSLLSLAWNYPRQSIKVGEASVNPELAAHGIAKLTAVKKYQNAEKTDTIQFRLEWNKQVKGTDEWGYRLPRGQTREAYEERLKAVESPFFPEPAEFYLSTQTAERKTAVIGKTRDGKEYKLTLEKVEKSGSTFNLNVPGGASAVWSAIETGKPVRHSPIIVSVLAAYAYDSGQAWAKVRVEWEDSLTTPVLTPDSYPTDIFPRPPETTKLALDLAVDQPFYFIITSDTGAQKRFELKVTKIEDHAPALVIGRVPLVSKEATLTVKEAGAAAAPVSLSLVQGEVTTAGLPTEIAQMAIAPGAVTDKVNVLIWSIDVPIPVRAKNLEVSLDNPEPFTSKDSERTVRLKLEANLGDKVMITAGSPVYATGLVGWAGRQAFDCVGFVDDHGQFTKTPPNTVTYNPAEESYEFKVIYNPVCGICASYKPGDSVKPLFVFNINMLGVDQKVQLSAACEADVLVATIGKNPAYGLELNSPDLILGGVVAYANMLKEQAPSLSVRYIVLDSPVASFSFNTPSEEFFGKNAFAGFNPSDVKSGEQTLSLDLKDKEIKNVEVPDQADDPNNRLSDYEISLQSLSAPISIQESFDLSKEKNLKMEAKLLDAIPVTLQLKGDVIKQNQWRITTGNAASLYEADVPQLIEIARLKGLLTKDETMHLFFLAESDGKVTPYLEFKDASGSSDLLVSPALVEYSSTSELAKGLKDPIEITRNGKTMKFRLVIVKSEQDAQKKFTNLEVYTYAWLSVMLHGKELKISLGDTHSASNVDVTYKGLLGTIVKLSSKIGGSSVASKAQFALLEQKLPMVSRYSYLLVGQTVPSDDLFDQRVEFWKLKSLTSDKAELTYALFDQEVAMYEFRLAVNKAFTRLKEKVLTKPSGEGSFILLLGPDLLLPMQKYWDEDYEQYDGPVWTDDPYAISATYAKTLWPLATSGDYDALVARMPSYIGRSINSWFTKISGSYSRADAQGWKDKLTDARKDGDRFRVADHPVYLNAWLAENPAYSPAIGTRKPHEKLLSEVDAVYPLFGTGAGIPGNRRMLQQYWDVKKELIGKHLTADIQSLVAYGDPTATLERT